MPYGPRINAGRNALAQAIMNLRNPPPGGGSMPAGGSQTSFAQPMQQIGQGLANKLAGGAPAPGSIGMPRPQTGGNMANVAQSYMGLPFGANGGGGAAPQAPYTGMSMQQMSQPFQPAQGPQMQPGQAWGSPPPIPQG